MNQRIGRRSIKFENPPTLLTAAASAGVKEGEGPMNKYFDRIITDEYMGEDSWEKAESKIQKETAELALKKAQFSDKDVDFIFAGDLQNQCVATNYGMKDFSSSFFGLYGACSTMTESLTLGSLSIAGGFAKNVMCITSSHFCTAEKQFRFPLEYGGQRTPTSQWTVTGSGCAILTKHETPPYITYLTPGRIVDLGISDVNNMGAAMAPAAADTLTAHFLDTGRRPDYYDMILTGDLGYIGSELLYELMNEKGYNIKANHKDAGKLIFDRKEQDVHAGGSGCGCMASIFCGYIYSELKEKKLNKVLVMATGALMNTLTVQQGNTIPGIAHAVSIENEVV